MEPLEPITNVQPQPIVRVIHLRENLFLVGYAYGGLIELRDFSKASKTGSEPDEPLASWRPQADEDENPFQYMRDFDCKNGDETQIVIIYDSHRIGFLNLRTRDFLSQKRYNTTASLRQVKYLRNLEGNYFTLLTEDNWSDR